MQTKKESIMVLGVFVVGNYGKIHQFSKIVVTLEKRGHEEQDNEAGRIVNMEEFEEKLIEKEEEGNHTIYVKPTLKEFLRRGLGNSHEILMRYLKTNPNFVRKYNKLVKELEGKDGI